MQLVKISDLFETKYGVNLELNKLKSTNKKKRGYLSFVSRTSKNNGVVAYVEEIENLTPNLPNTISVAAGGSVGTAFLQKEPYYSGRDLFVLKPKINLSDYEMLFYCLCITFNKYKFSYGRQMNKTLTDLLIPSLNSIPKWVYNKKRISKIHKNTILKNKISLTDRRWKYFEFQQLFDIQRGKESNMSVLDDGIIHLISSSQFNNGLKRKVKNGQKLFHANSITVANSGSVGSSFYQKQDFYAATSVTVLNNDNINSYNALFIISLIEKEKMKFSYGRAWSLYRMEKHKIMLPIDSHGKPDWLFMENYIKSLPYSVNLKD